MARGDEGSGTAAARFHGAAAVALRDAKHPGEVTRILGAVRRVVLCEDGAGGVFGTPDRDGGVGPTSRSASASGSDHGASSKPVFPDTVFALHSLADDCAGLPQGSCWDGFQAVGEQMLHRVSHLWLPCFTHAQTQHLFRDVLRAMPASLTVRVLVPALGPSRTRIGKSLRASEQHIVASVAATALARAVVHNVGRKLLQESYGNSVAETEDDARLLLSAADRLELVPGSLLGDDLTTLSRPHLFASEMAKQFIAAVYDDAGGAESDAKNNPKKENSKNVSLEIAATAFSVLARRGHAPAVAEALVGFVTQMDGGMDGAVASADASEKPRSGSSPEESKSSSSSLNTHTATWSPEALQNLVAEIPDAFCVAKLISAILKLCDARKTEWRAVERILRVTLAKRFWGCDSTRHMLHDVLLVRKVVPRKVLPALVRFVLVSPPTPDSDFLKGETSEDSEHQKEKETKTKTRTSRHRTRALASIADAWSDLDVVRNGSRALRGHVASVTAAALAAVPVDLWRGGSILEDGGGEGDFGLRGAASLMRGVSARLDSPDSDTRRHGRKVASALALAIDPKKPLTFNDDEDFGVGDNFHDLEDVSEDEAEWEKNAGALRVECGDFGDPNVDEDDFVSSLVGDGHGGANGNAAEAHVSEKTNVTAASTRDDSEAHVCSSEVESESDTDDPDARVAMGAGCVSESTDTDTDDSDDSDDSDTSSVLTPYDMDSDDASDSDCGDDFDLDGTGDGDTAGNALDDAAKTHRAKRRAVVAKKRIAALPKPESLSKTIEALHSKKDAHDTSRGSATDRADACEGAVYHCETLIRSVPEELINAAASLVTALVHAHPPTPDVVGLQRARRKALVALAATAPGIAGPALCAEAFLTGRCDAGQQLEVLDVVADAARELSSLPAINRGLLMDTEDDGDDSFVFGAGRIGSGDLSGQKSKTGQKLGVERRFAPKSLARLRHGTLNQSETPQRTRTHLVVDAFAGPLLARLGRLVLTAEIDATQSKIAEQNYKKDKEAVHVPGGGIDAIVLGRALGCLGELCAASRNAPNAAQLSGAVLELLSNQAVHNHHQPHVRRAALFAAYGALTSVPPGVAWNALVGGMGNESSGGNAGGGASVSRLGRLLGWAESWAEQSHVTDADDTTRGLALRCALAGADLRQKASQAGRRNENRNDPLFMLKNLTSLALEL